MLKQNGYTEDEIEVFMERKEGVLLVVNHL
jgi:hypothetical protein